MASIMRRPRSDGTTAWRVQYRDPGNRTPTGATFDDYDTAERFSDLVDRLGGPAARRILERSEHGDTSPTLTAALADYLARSHDITDGTKDDYERIFDRSTITERLGELPVSTITDDDVHAWLAHRSSMISEQTGAGLSAKTIHNEHGILSTVLQHAVTRGWATGNPAKGVRLPRLDPADPLEITRAQYEAIHKAMDPDYQALVEFLAVTGVRWGEVTALQWRDITTGAPPRVTVRRAWKKGQKGAWRVEGLPKSDASHRSFTVPQKLVDKLGDRGPKGGLVFPNKAGTAITHSNFHQRKWVRACEAAKVMDPRPRIHDLRGYFASVMLAAGVPIHVVSRRLGHQNIGTTVRVYGHLTRDAQHAGLDDMEAMLL